MRATGGPFVRYIAAGCPLRCDFANVDQPDSVAKGALPCARARARAGAHLSFVFVSFAPFPPTPLALYPVVFLFLLSFSLSPSRSLSLPRCFSSLIASRPASPPLPAAPAFSPFYFLFLILTPIARTAMRSPSPISRVRV